MNVLGIDPGFSGGLVLLNGKGHIERTYVMPIFTIDKKKTRKYRKNESNPGNKKTKTYTAKVKNLDISLLYSWLSNNFYLIDIVYLERVSPRPMEGVSSVARFAEQFGIIQGLLISLKLKHVIITPKEWTKKMHVGIPGTIKDTKEKSLLASKRLFPNEDFVVKRKPHDGLIDAALIAMFGKNREIGETT